MLRLLPLGNWSWHRETSNSSYQNGQKKCQNDLFLFNRFIFSSLGGLAYIYARFSLVPLSAIETRPEYRHRGLGTALMETIHADAAAMGQTESILCASEPGYELYRKLGYQTITTVLELVPKSTIF